MTFDTVRIASIAAVAIAMTAPAASAQVYQGRSAHAPRYYESPGEIIARRTEEAQHEPGVTAELAPDSRQTATGGPVGGVPGYDGF